MRTDIKHIWEKQDTEAVAAYINDLDVNGYRTIYYDEIDLDPVHSVKITAFLTEEEGLKQVKNLQVDIYKNGHYLMMDDENYIEPLINKQLSKWKK